MRRNRGNEDGFTLVEILTVLVIIVILASVAIPAMAGFIEDGKKKSYVAEALTAFSVLQVYLLEQYAAGSLEDIDDMALMAPFDDKYDPNPLTERMRGSFTPGANINGFAKRDADGMLLYIAYRVDKYEIEIQPNREVVIKKIK